MANFINTSKNYEFLSAEDEIKYFAEYQTTGSIEARDTILKAFIRLVISMSRKYANGGIELDDLVQEGNIGLLKAIEKFDSSIGVRFSTIAMFYIKSAILEYNLNNQRMVKIATTKPKRKILFNLQKFLDESESRYLTTETAQKVATSLNVNVDEVWEMDRRIRTADVSIDYEMSENDGESDIQHMIDPALVVYLDPTAQLEFFERENLVHNRIPEALNSVLDERQRAIVRSRWMAEDDESKTLEVLAAEYGVSFQRILQIEKQAMTKMRKYLETQP